MTNREAADFLESALASVRLTRCHDCKYFAEWASGSDDYGDCTRNRQVCGVIVAKDYFCAEGKGKDDD